MMEHIAIVVELRLYRGDKYESMYYPEKAPIPRIGEHITMPLDSKEVFVVEDVVHHIITPGLSLKRADIKVICRLVKPKKKV